MLKHKKIFMNKKENLISFCSGNTEHQHHLVERADDQKNAMKFGVFAGMTIGQFCANWMSSGWGGEPPSSPRPPATRPTPRSKQVFSTKKPLLARVQDDCHLLDENTEDEDSSDHIDHDYIDQANEREEANRNSLAYRYRNQPTPHPLPTRRPSTPAPRPGPSNDRQRPSKRPSVDGQQGGAPDPKRPRPQGEATQNRVLPPYNPDDGINYPIDPRARTIPQAVITYQNLILVETAIQEVERRIVTANAELVQATDDFGREVSYFSRRWTILNFNPQRFSQEAKDSLRTRCNIRRRVQTDRMAGVMHNLNFLRRLRESLHNQQNAFRLGLAHIARFQGREIPPFVVVFNWQNVAQIEDDRVIYNRVFHRPRREGEVDGDFPHEVANVETIEEYNKEISNTNINGFKIISFLNTTQNCPSTWFIAKSAKFEELMRSIQYLYWAFEETVFGWHYSSHWYLVRTVDSMMIFSNLTDALKTDINENNIEEKYDLAFKIEDLISSKINRKLLWYYDPVACFDDLDAKFKMYEAKANPHKTVDKIAKIQKIHDELKKRSDQIGL